jgi:hypothetical protein
VLHAPVRHIGQRVPDINNIRFHHRAAPGLALVGEQRPEGLQIHAGWSGRVAVSREK